MAISLRSRRRPWWLDHHALSAFAAELYSTTIAERNASRRCRQLIGCVFIRAIFRSIIVWAIIVRTIWLREQLEFGIDSGAAPGFAATTAVKSRSITLLR